MLLKYVAYYISLFFGFNIFHRLGRYFERLVAFEAERNASTKYFSHFVATLPNQDFNNSGNISNRIKTAAEALHAFAETQFQYIEYFMKFWGPLIALAIIDPVLSIIALILSISTILVIAFFDKRLTVLFEKENQVYHKYVELLIEYIGHSRTIFQSGKLEKFHHKLKDKFNLGLPILKKVIFLNQTKWFLVSFGILLVEIGILTIYIAKSYYSGALISIGVSAAILQYMNQLSSTFFNIAGSYYNIIQWKVKFDSTKEIESVNKPPAVIRKDNWEAIFVDKLQANIDSFQLNINDFVVNRGEKICLVGPSGSGKTSIIEALSGIRADIDIELSPDHSCLPNFVLVQQKPEIFSDTLEFNITFGDEHIKLGDVINMVELEDFVARKGIDFDIENGGDNLSGGQLQRISVARGLFSLGSHDILLLDEPTSSLDSRTAHKLISSVLKKLPDHTIISIVHDPSLVRYFDRVIRLEDGKIVSDRVIEQEREV